MKKSYIAQNFSIDELLPVAETDALLVNDHLYELSLNLNKFSDEALLEILEFLKQNQKELRHVPGDDSDFLEFKIRHLMSDYTSRQKASLIRDYTIGRTCEEIVGVMVQELHSRNKPDVLKGLFDRQFPAFLGNLLLPDNAQIVPDYMMSDRGFGDKVLNLRHSYPKRLRSSMIKVMNIAASTQGKPEFFKWLLDKDYMVSWKNADDQESDKVLNFADPRSFHDLHKHSVRIMMEYLMKHRKHDLISVKRHEAHMLVEYWIKKSWKQLKGETFKYLHLEGKLNEVDFKDLLFGSNEKRMEVLGISW